MHPLAEQYRDLFERPRRFIFLVSHMRSYSSLLGHLLAETESIDGYSELHRTYESELDLVRLPIDVQATQSEPLGGDYLFDKILHRAYTVAPSLAARDDVKIIFSIRTPEPTLASMVALGESDRSVRWAAEPERALLHYERRLDDICALAATAPAASLLIADRLVDAPRQTLDSVAAFLELNEVIPEQYSLHPLTGQKKFGDSSAAITSGAITAEPSASGKALPPSVLAAGREIYNATLARRELAGLVRLSGPTSDQ